MAEKKKVTGRLVPAVDRAARILALIEAESRPMSITEIARTLLASKGTVREILETLRSHGLLERDDDTKLYRLGPQLVRLGASSRDGQDFVAIARPRLAELSDSLREIVLLLVPQRDRLFIQEVLEPTDPRSPIVVAASPGRSIPITAGACGKVVMAWSDSRKNANLLKSDGHAPAPSAAELASVRRNGYAIDNGEFIDGIRGVSAPIFGDAGQLLGLILVSGIAASWSIERLEEVGEAVHLSADSISAALGGPGIPLPDPGAESDSIKPAKAAS